MGLSDLLSGLFEGTGDDESAAGSGGQSADTDAESAADDRPSFGPAADNPDCPPTNTEEAASVIPAVPEGLAKDKEEAVEFGDQRRYDVYYTDDDGATYWVAFKFYETVEEAEEYANTYAGSSLGSEGALEAWIAAIDGTTVYTVSGPTTEYRDGIIALYEALPCAGDEHVVDTML